MSVEVTSNHHSSSVIISMDDRQLPSIQPGLSSNEKSFKTGDMTYVGLILYDISY